MINPDYRGPTALSTVVTERWTQSRHRAAPVTTTKFTPRSRTRLANLARKVPTQAELRLRARGLVTF